MAKKIMTPVKADYNKITKVTFESANDTTGFEVKLNSNDESTFILVSNTDTAAKSITVKAPTKGGYAAATSDMTLSIPASGIAVIRVESARYSNTDGTIVIVPEATTVKAVVVC